MKLTIVIPTLNDQAEVVETVKSIRETTPPGVEVIVIDDCSYPPVTIPKELCVRFIKNVKRIGVAQSRHLGAELASGDFLLFLDSHMRCEPGWYEAAMNRLSDNPTTFYNGCTLGLSAGKMDVARFKDVASGQPGTYTGARLVIYDPQERNNAYSILEGKWQPHPDNAELSCCMGAVYFCPRKPFLDIGGLKSLEQWGTDEPLLTLKVWLAGYEMRQMNTVRIGHKFRNVPDAPYRTGTFWMPYNKMRTIITLFSADVAEFLIKKFPQNTDTSLALKEIAARSDSIKREQEFLKSIFHYDLNWFCDKFPNVKHPLK